MPHANLLDIGVGEKFDFMVQGNVFSFIGLKLS